MSGLTKEQNWAFEVFKKGKSMCITGPAGCGKSYIIKHIVNFCKMNKIVCYVTATTGAAASLIEGQTYHRWSGIGTGKNDVNSIVEYINKYRPDARARWLDAQVLVIDEISMMSSEMFNKLNLVAQKVRNSGLFFGGIQVILCGDFAQLEPVKADSMCFESLEWEKYISPNTIYLRKILRQCDPDFLQLLEEVRLGRVTQKTKDILNSRIIPDPEAVVTEFEGVKEKVRPTVLYPHKVDVERINQAKLAALISAGAENKRFISADSAVQKRTKQGREISKIESELLDKQCNAPHMLELCIGAQVMLISNLDPEEGLVNGSLGVVRQLSPNVVIIFDNGCETTIDRKDFEVDDGNVMLVRKQLPLILAWAMTIHKCQGATLSNVITDLSKVFCNAQIYVTLSRVKTLEGLYLQGINYGGVKCNPKVRKYYKSLDGPKDLEKICSDKV